MFIVDQSTLGEFDRYACSNSRLADGDEVTGDPTADHVVETIGREMEHQLLASCGQSFAEVKTLRARQFSEEDLELLVSLASVELPVATRST